MDFAPLRPTNLTANVSPAIKDALLAGGFDVATPLWYYVLQEANYQHQGRFLGSVGSRLVAETLAGLIWRYPSSYLHFSQDSAVKPNGIEVAAGHVIGTMADLLTFSGAPI